jgi:hypothetical protein
LNLAFKRMHCQTPLCRAARPIDTDLARVNNRAAEPADAVSV